SAVGDKVASERGGDSVWFCVSVGLGSAGGRRVPVACAFTVGCRDGTSEAVAIAIAFFAGADVRRTRRVGVS
ncbi:MAG TPA: hypothetical protein VFD70_15515, partial [Anaerolineae bacterium]|nr:hypothetical protein [Anaerolineae bacterium]